EDIPFSPPPERYRRASEDTWDAAREDYLSGWSAPQVCARHGLGLSNLKARAREEGWRRADQPEPDRPSFEEEAAADTGPMPSWREQAEVSRRAMNRAQNKGDALEAHRWLRLHRDQLRQAQAEEAEARAAEARAELGRSPEVQAELEALREARERFIRMEMESLTRLANSGRRRLNAGMLDDGEADELGQLDAALDQLDADQEPKVHDVHSECAGPAPSPLPLADGGEVGKGGVHAEASEEAREAEDSSSGAFPSETAPAPFAEEPASKVHEVHAQSAPPPPPEEPWHGRAWVPSGARWVR
ncbi:MAG TPA: hypothetical protein VF559_00290, partial [Caulobacteraceae bacterium]